MRPTAGRNFGVADGLILVAATAAGLAACRMMAPELSPDVLWREIFTRPKKGWSIGYALEVSYVLGSLLVTPCLAAWTLGWLLLRSRGPRTPRRRLVREPGAMACLVAVVSIVFTAGGGLVLRTIADPRHPPHEAWLLGGGAFSAFQAGVAVFWCWATMALCGRWRPAPTWLDRSGRLLGAAWVAAAVLYGCVTVGLWPF